MQAEPQVAHHRMHLLDRPPQLVPGWSHNHKVIHIAHVEQAVAPPEPIDARNNAQDVYQRLNQIDIDTETDVPFLRFSSEAQGAFNEWRTKLSIRIRNRSELPIMEAHLSKYRSLIPALALIDHLVEGTEGAVAYQSFIRATALGGYLESHARRIYAPVINPAPAAAQALADRILRGHVIDGFSLRSNVYQNGWSRLTSAADAQMAADILESRGWIYGVEKSTGGRSAIVSNINPKILERVHG